MSNSCTVKYGAVAFRWDNCVVTSTYDKYCEMILTNFFRNIADGTNLILISEKEWKHRNSLKVPPTIGEQVCSDLKCDKYPLMEANAISVNLVICYCYSN